VPWGQVYLGVLVASGLAILAVLTSSMWRHLAYTILGPQYEEGTALAGNLLLLSAIPLALNSALTAALRYLNALRGLMIAATVTTGTVVTVTAVLVPRFDVNGAAIGWLTGQCVGSLAFIAFAVHARRNT
jgi:O-antigen/teichoic acid export membrane protein